jgi:hypothetical protein
MEILAAQRLVADAQASHLFTELKPRLPAVFNRIDDTIGFKCETGRVLRVLDLLGFRKEGNNTFRNKDYRVRIFEPRDGWNPVLQVL